MKKGQIEGLTQDGRCFKQKPREICNKIKGAKELGIECTPRLRKAFRDKGVCCYMINGKGPCVKYGMDSTITPRTPIVDNQVRRMGGLFRRS